jgi:hypothetical protein
MSAPTLDYAVLPRRRRWLRRAVLVVLIAALGYSAWRWGPEAWRRASLLHRQRQCLNYTAAPDMVVYEEEPAAAAKLLARSQGDYAAYPLQRGKGLPATARAVDAAAHLPHCWSQYQPQAATVMMQFGRAYGAIVFLHERASPSGHRRLVSVRYFPDNDTFTPSFVPGHTCELIAITPATLTKPAKVAPRMYIIDVISTWPRVPANVRMFAGQPDPDDPSRFTIRYQMWGKEDILDGRLGDDDQVTLTPRNLPEMP